MQNFADALMSYQRGEMALENALKREGFDAQPYEMNMVLSYAGQQLLQAEARGSGSDVQYQAKNDKAYTYEALISKPGIQLTQLEETTPEVEHEIKAGKSRDFAKTAIERIKEQNGGEAYIPNNDTGKRVLVGIESIKHSMTRGSLKTYIQVVNNLDGLLRNAIAINELNPRDESTNYSTVLLGVGETKDSIVPVRFVVNNKTWKMESYDILYAISKTAIKKEEARQLAPGFPIESDFGTSSSISVAELLNLVKNYKEISSVLSKDVTENLGYERPFNPKLTEGLRFSLKKPIEQADIAKSDVDVSEDVELYAQVNMDKDAETALQMVQKLYAMTVGGKGYLGEETGNRRIEKGAWKNRLDELVQRLKDETGSTYSDRFIKKSLSNLFTAMDGGASRSDNIQYAVKPPAKTDTEKQDSGMKTCSILGSFHWESARTGIRRRLWRMQANEGPMRHKVRHSGLLHTDTRATKVKYEKDHQTASLE